MLAVQLLMLFVLTGANITNYPGMTLCFYCTAVVCTFIFVNTMIVFVIVVGALYQHIVHDTIQQASLLMTIVSTATSPLHSQFVTSILQASTLLSFAVASILFHLLYCAACFLLREFYR